jgi:hypothetical protein
MIHDVNVTVEVKLSYWAFTNVLYRSKRDKNIITIVTGASIKRTPSISYRGPRSNPSYQGFNQKDALFSVLGQFKCPPLQQCSYV